MVTVLDTVIQDAVDANSQLSVFLYNNWIIIDSDALESDARFNLQHV